MAKPITYMGKGGVSLGDSREVAHYTLNISTSASGIKSGSGSFTSEGDGPIKRSAKEQQEASLTLESGETVNILVEDGDPLLRQYKFVANGPLPISLPPKRRPNK